MKKTGKIYHLRLLVLCASCSGLLLSGCAGGVQAASSAPAAPAAREASSLPAASQAQAEQELPRESQRYRQAELETYQQLGAQLFLGEEAYPLAESIYNYRDYHNMFIFTDSFTDITQLEPELLIEIAASQAPRVDLYSRTFRASQGPVRSFYLAQREAGKPVGMISYGADVRRKAQELFGEAYTLPRQDGLTVRYEPQLDIYYLGAQDVSSMSSDYPILLEVRQEGDRYTVKSILLSYWSFSGTWSNPDGSWESDEYCSMEAVRSYLDSEARNDLPVLTFTLEKAGDLYRMVGFQREQAA